MVNLRIIIGCHSSLDSRRFNDVTGSHFPNTPDFGFNYLMLESVNCTESFLSIKNQVVGVVIFVVFKVIFVVSSNTVVIFAVFLFKYSFWLPTKL